MAPELEILAALTPVVEALEALGIDYRIGGSVASSLHGTPRATNDVDLVADIHAEHVEPLCRALRGRFMADEELLRMAVAHQTCCNFIHLPTVYKVDVFVRKRGVYEDQAFARSERKRLSEDGQGREFFVSTAEDMVLRKLCWYRAGGGVSLQQWRDVLGMLRGRRGKLDLEYLRRWAVELRVDDLLDQALAEAAS